MSALSMHPISRPLVLALLMIAASLVPYAVNLSLSPKAKPTEPAFVLEELVPTRFSAWRMVETDGAQVVNPQAQALIDKLYSQLLTRTYVHADGYRIMLSIAYGNEQRGGLEAHMPEVCYPAQGFALNDRSLALIATADGPISVKRFEAQMGGRIEPVTYWFRLGDQTIGGVSSFDRRMVQLRFALSGQVPDGLLFRVSSIDNQRNHAYMRHEQFVADLLAAIGPAGRMHLVVDAAR